MSEKATWRSGDETAALVGRLCAVSRRLHQILGASALRASSSAASIAFDEWSLEHAFHAELLFERLPRRAGIDPGALVELGALGGALELLEELGSGGDDVGIGAGYARVLLPRLRTSCAALSEGTSEAAERSLRRALRLIESDLAEATLASEELVESLCSSPGATEHAIRVTGDLEAVLGDSRGLFGP